MSLFTDLLIGILQMDRDIPNVLASRIHKHQATSVLNTAHVDMSQKPRTTPTDSWCSWMTFTHSCPVCLVFEILCHTFVPTRIPQKKESPHNRGAMDSGSRAHVTMDLLKRSSKNNKYTL